MSPETGSCNNTLLDKPFGWAQTVRYDGPNHEER